jgi:hypothetical protein
MGMMDQMPPVEQSSAPAESGMMGGQQQGGDPSLSHGKFNATVMVDGKPVQVQGGVAKVDGQPFMVSDNGAIVADAKGNLVGHVEGDQFVPVDEQYLKLMQEKGYVQ